MATFQEIGAYLDKLYVDGNLDLMKKIVEVLVHPKININPTPDDLQWSECSPIVNYECVQLTKENVDSIRLYLIGGCGFFEAQIKDFGLDTDYGMIKWNEWLVLEPNSAVVFYTEDDFASSFTINS